MILIKNLFILSIIFLFLNGCSSMNQPGNDNFLTDTSTEETDKKAHKEHDKGAIDPVLESTRIVLQSTPAPMSVQEQLNKYLNQPHEPHEYDNVWNRLPSTFQISDIDNPRIQTHKKWYIKHKKYLTRVSERANPYLFYIIEEVEKRNIPGEIALLPIIESAFRTNAYSRMRAAGLWQFIPATGKHFGLKQNWWFDGRRDIHLSTHAALTYLEQLNKYYNGDWLLALAAYNAGAGNVNKAVRKNRKKGKAIDFWSLDLPRETKNYVPKLLAVAQLIKNPDQYDITLNPVENSPQLMLVDIKSQIDLSLVSKLTNISVNDLKSYNPAIKRWATDPEGPHHLLLPINKVNQFEKDLALVDDKDRVQHYRHKIRSGESLSVIARKYNLSISALKKANHLKSNRIRAGKYLMVPLPKNTDIASLSNKQRKSARNKSINRDKWQTYIVRSGDSFWKIARRYNTSHRKLASLNNLSPGDTLSIGQELKIKPLHLKTAKKIRKAVDLAKAKEISYKVKQGDSLYVISRRFNVSINELKSWNGLHSKKYLQPGQELKVYINSFDSQAI